MRLRFSHTFMVSGAPVAFAFAFPYTYQQLQSDLDKISREHGAGRPEECLFGCSMRSAAQGQGRRFACCNPSTVGVLECGEAVQLKPASDGGQHFPGESSPPGATAGTRSLPAGLTAAARSMCACHSSLPDCSCGVLQWRRSWHQKTLPGTSTSALGCASEQCMVCAEPALSAEEGRQPSGTFSVQASGCRASASGSALEQIPDADSSCGSSSDATSWCSTAASGAAPGLPSPEQVEAAGQKELSDEGSAVSADCEADSPLHRQSSPGCPGRAARGGCKHDLERLPATVAGQGCTDRPTLPSFGSLDSLRWAYSIQAAAGARASSASEAAQHLNMSEHVGVDKACDAGSSVSEQHGSDGQVFNAAMQSLRMPTARPQPAAGFHVMQHLLARSIEGRRIDMVTITGPEEPGAVIADRPVSFFL